jgi:phage terminase large subunit GpA-like protein
MTSTTNKRGRTKTPLVQRLTAAVWEEWTPPPEIRARDWIPENVVIPDETESPGPFDMDLVPHVEGVLDAVDDPDVHDIYLCWAARNAKTTTAFSILSYFAGVKPRPMMYGNADEEVANDAIETQFYPLLESCEPLRRKLPPAHKRNKKMVKLDRCRIRRSYAGSPASMRGFPACYALASEISAWPTRKSNDANALHLFGQRGKLFPFDRKYIYESTPAMVGNCKISELISKPGVDVRIRIVPCPHCGEYQQLTFGTSDADSAGIKWDKKHGHATPQQAEETAWYQCVNGCRIENDDRPAMMRMGVWWPVDDPLPPKRDRRRRRKLADPPFRSSSVGFDKLSTLYSLLISGWGQLAREWLEVKDNPEALRDFINSTLCQTWDPAPKTVEPLELGARLAGFTSQSVCPDWSVFLTEAIDVQEGASEFHWSVCAWGQHARGAVVDYGVCLGEESLLYHLTHESAYPHEDGGPTLSPLRRAIDSGDGEFTEYIYSLCRRNKPLHLIPVKGDNKSNFVEMAVPSIIDPNKKRRRSRRHSHKLVTDVIYRINTNRTQDWVESIIHDRIKPDDDDGFTLAREIALDEQFLEELLNERAVWEKKDNGYKVRSWRKIGPNEQRDTLRYNRAMAEMVTNHGKHWKKQRRQTTVRRRDTQRPEPKTGPAFGSPTMSIVGLSAGRPDLIPGGRNG